LSTTSSGSTGDSTGVFSDAAKSAKHITLFLDRFLTAVMVRFVVVVFMVTIGDRAHFTRITLNQFLIQSSTFNDIETFAFFSPYHFPVSYG